MIDRARPAVTSSGLPRPLAQAPASRSIPRRAAVLTAVLAAAALAAGCSSPSVPAFDLTAPRQPVAGGGLVAGQLVVAEPAALQPLEAERILVRDAAGAVSYLAGAQWADRLPRLFQARLVQTFENASRIRAVARPGEGVSGDFQLNTELRAFQLDATTGEAFVEVSAKLLAIPTSRISYARVFTARVPAGSVAGPAVAQALDTALSTVLLDIVRWVGTSR